MDGGGAADEISHIEAAVRSTEDALIESDVGDVLVFMPTERDIRETRDALEGSLGAGIEVLGLFGRMAAAEQQRIFAPGAAAARGRGHEYRGDIDHPAPGPLCD